MGAFSLVSKAGLRLGIEHPRDFGAFNTFPRSVWAHTPAIASATPSAGAGTPHHPLCLLLSFHPSFLPSYLPAYFPTDPVLRPSSLLPSLATLSSPQSSSFLPPLAIAFHVSCARPPFLLLYFFTNCASALRRSPGSPHCGESHRIFVVLPILYFRLCF